MENKNNISSLLNHKLNLIGSKIRLDSEINDIGEQIASKVWKHRSVEIVELEYEKQVWISFYHKSLNLGNKTTQDIDEIAQSVYYFLEQEAQLKYFFNHKFGIKPPFKLPKKVNEEQLLIELEWFYFLSSDNSNSYEPVEWNIIKELAKKIKQMSYSKELIPYRSLNRLSFKLSHNSFEKDFPYIWASINEHGIKVYHISDLNKTYLRLDSEYKVLTEYEKQYYLITETNN